MSIVREPCLSIKAFHQSAFFLPSLTVSVLVYVSVCVSSSSLSLGSLPTGSCRTIRSHSNADVYSMPNAEHLITKLFHW